MRVGMVGLATLYWPIAIGNGLQAKGVEYLAAATLGASEAAIVGTLGVSSGEYASKYGIALYEDAEEMITRERLFYTPCSSPEVKDVLFLWNINRLWNSPMMNILLSLLLSVVCISITLAP